MINLEKILPFKQKLTDNKEKQNHSSSRLGILEVPNPKVAVTGSVRMMDDQDNDTDVDTLKKSVTGIILNPQPHDSPNDPLNWPIWKRDLSLAIIGFQSFIGGGQSPILAAGMNSLVVEFNRPLTTISYLVGGFMLSLGFGSVIASPFAVLYGKRLVYICGIFIFMMGAIWGALSPSFGSLMGARVLTGIGASPTECLPSSTIAEIYFAHERAYRVGLYTMLMLGGKNIIPLLSGLVFQNLDRHWLFWILAIFLGFILILTILFVPDTFWDRTPIPNKRSIEETKAAQSVATYHPPSQRPNAFALYRQPSTMTDLQSLSSNDTYNQHEQQPVTITEPEVVFQKRSFLEDIKLYHGRFTKDSWWMVALRPFALYSYPHIFFGSLTYALAVVWLIVISETISEIFRNPPYGFDQQTVGLFYISPFVGGILGSLSCGLISDRVCRLLVTKNKGIYEPEFRLIMIIPSTLFIAIGLMGYGWSSNVHNPWVAPVLFFGCLSFGSSMASTTAITFAVDSYRMFSAESLVSFNFLKNFLGFCFSLFNNRYNDKEGYKIPHVTYGCIQIFVSLWGIILYRYGKRIRRWTDEKEIMRFLYHEDNKPKSIASRSTNEKDIDDELSTDEVLNSSK